MVGERSYVLDPAAQDGWFPLASSFVFLRKGRGILPYSYSKSLSPQKSTKESSAELIPSWSVTVVVPNVSLKGLKICLFVCLFLKGDTFYSIN